MASSEREAAFTKLVATRNRMLEIRKQMTESRASRQIFSDHDFRVASRRHNELLVEWEKAFREFQAATGEFSESVRQIPEEAERGTR